jgi:hypothetical protein
MSLDERHISALQHFLMEGAANYGTVASGDVASEALAAAADLDYAKLVVSGVAPEARGATSHASAQELVQRALLQCVTLARAALAGPPALIRDFLERYARPGGILSVMEALAADPGVGSDDVRFTVIALRTDVAQARRLGE